MQTPPPTYKPNGGWSIQVCPIGCLVDISIAMSDKTEEEYEKLIVEQLKLARAQFPALEGLFCAKEKVFEMEVGVVLRFYYGPKENAHLLQDMDLDEVETAPQT